MLLIARLVRYVSKSALKGYFEQNFGFIMFALRDFLFFFLTTLSNIEELPKSKLGIIARVKKKFKKEQSPSKYL
jgi:hypothetical protein